MNEGLFAYGTLRDPELMGAIAGKRLRRTDARLPDHAAYRVRGADYPGLVTQAGGLVPGVLWEGLDTAALRRLDRYEGALYTRQRVRVLTDRGARIAWVYLIRSQYRARLGDEPWDGSGLSRGGQGGTR